MTGKQTQSPTLYISVYIILLLAFFGGSFHTGMRLWGLSTWGYLPIWIRIAFLGIGLAAIPLALKCARSETEGSPTRRGAAILMVAGLALVAGVCFWLFRGQTHFLGDGYGNISALSSRVPNVNFRDLGEVLAHLSLARLFGGNSEANVILSYQIISIVAGILMIVAVGLTATALYVTWRDSMLFSLAVILSGQILLSFGYVENYSIFVLAVTCFGLLGVAAALGKVARWVVIIPLVGAAACHVLGVVLIVPAAYLLLAGGEVERKISNMSGPGKIGLVLALLVAGGTVLWVVREQSLFFRIALLSLTQSRFTVEGYTLFSGAHVADFGNLLLLLVPGFPLLLIGIGELPWRILAARTAYRFLLLMTGTAIVAAFIFDPKLGMPRDWDLFSFIALPLSMLFAFACLDNQNRWPMGRIVLTLAVVLAGLGGAARVATQAVPSMALLQINDYLTLDRTKCKGTLVLLQSYYAEKRDRERFDYWGERFTAYPEEQMIMQADSLIKQNRLAEALERLNLAVKFNPMSSGPYKNISVIHMLMGQEGAARAAIDTALAISPGNPDALVGKGFFLQKDGAIDKAERSYIRATELAPHKSLAWYYLAKLRQSLGDTAQYVQFLDSSASRNDAAPELHIELCNVYISKGRYREAAEQLQIGLSLGLSRQAVEGIVKSHPQLQEYLTP